MFMFGLGKEEAWQSLCKELGARYIEGGFWKHDWVEYDVGHWRITLELYVVSTGKTTVVYTRIRAPYAANGDFSFKIYSSGILSGLERFLGAQDITIGDEILDEAFMIKGNDAESLISILKDPSLYSLLMEQRHVDIGVRHGKTFWETSLPNGVHELVFRETGVITDLPRLIGLLQLMTRFLVVMLQHGLIKPESVEP